VIFRAWLLGAALVTLAQAAWIDVPFYPQEKNGCGAASAAMLIRYWNPRAAPDPRLIQQRIYSPEAAGAYGTALSLYLEDQGFRSFAFAGSIDDLREHTAKGRPLIVALAGSGPAGLHYVVAVGIEENAVLLNDPADRKLRRMNRARFERDWQASGRWTLLAAPRQP
jgi:predicted double-glycine peptidase